METLRLKPLSRHFAVEVEGVDLSQPVSDELFRQIENAFNRHSIVVFRNQDLTEEQHVAFSRRFGELEVHVRKDMVKARFPEIFVVSNVIENGKAVGSIDAGQFWHTDLSYKANPSRGSLLLAREVPAQDGVTLGDTMFLSTMVAYEALPEAIKTRVDGLKAVHHYEKGYNRDRPSGKRPPLTEEQRRAVPDVSHPIARVHPFTGKKCLFVNEGYTTVVEGLPQAESDALLEMLFEHCVKDEFVYRHNWRVGDLVMWDNYATQHKAVGDYGPTLRRRMERTTLVGIGAAA